MLRRTPVPPKSIPVPSRRTALLSSTAASACSRCGLGEGPGRLPDRPVRIIVALSPGGSVDVIARTLGSGSPRRWASPSWSTTAGRVGPDRNARRGAGPADGYTLAVSPASFLTTNKSVFKALPYDPEADFAPVSRLVNQPMVLVVRDKQKYPTVAALLAAAKAAPERLTYASSGEGSPQHWPR
jgi:tripartite-type tricarboxylate transporter receptor subunit TctC